MLQGLRKALMESTTGVLKVLSDATNPPRVKVSVGEEKEREQVVKVDRSEF